MAIYRMASRSRQSFTNRYYSTNSSNRLVAHHADWLDESNCRKVA